MIVDARTLATAALAAGVLIIATGGASAQVFIEQLEPRQTARSTPAAESLSRSATEASAAASPALDSYSLRGVSKVITQSGSDNQATLSGQNEANRHATDADRLAEPDLADQQCVRHQPRHPCRTAMEMH